MNTRSTSITRTVPIRIIHVIIAVAAVSIPAVADTHWTAAEVVSTESSQSSGSVSTAIDHEGNLHLAWCDTTDFGGTGVDRDIFYKKRDADGTWTLTEVVSMESTLDSYSPSVCVDSSSNVYIAWADSYFVGYEDGEIFFKMKTSNGQWTTAELVSQPSSADFNSVEPTLAVDSSGNAHLSWVYRYIFDTDVYYRSRASNGAWSDIQNISAATYGGWAPHLLVDHGDKVHLVYVEDNWAGRVLYQFMYSGEIWSSPQDVSGVGDFWIRRAHLVVDRDNGLHVVWDDLDDYLGDGILYNNKPSPGTWGTNRFIASADWYSGFSLTATPDGNLHLAWRTDDAGIYDIYYMRWDGDAWIPRETLSTEFTQDSHAPSLVADDQGRLHIAWPSDFNYMGSGPDSDIFYKQNPAPSGTVGAELACVPGSGTVPFLTHITATVSNRYALFKRRLAVRMDVDLGNGQVWGNWRRGYTQLDPGESYINSWNQTIPALVTVLGSNVFSLHVEDVTPPPYNQPPYAPAGDTDMAACTVEAAAP